MTARRYPLSALVSASGLTEAGLGRLVGLSGSTLKSARTRGFTADAADRYANRAGFVPSEVWPDYGLVECAADDCTSLFAAVRAGHAYCSKRCRERVRVRVKYRTDPAFAERRRAAAAQQYAETRDYVRRRMRARHHANRETELERMRARYQRTKAEAA